MVTLTTLAVVALGVAVGVGTRVGWGWAVLPIGTWIVVFGVLRLWTEHTARRRIEARNREAQRQAAESRQQVAAFGREGVKLIDRAHSAVKRIQSSQAAREGWLGPAGELDFRTDLALIAEDLRQAAAIRQVMAQSTAIPGPPDPDSKRMLKEAKPAAKRLERAAAARVGLLADCANLAEQVDKALHEEKEQDRNSAWRDDVNSRLNAMLYGAEMAQTSPASDATDAVKARVMAFRELKGLVDQGRLTSGPSGTDEGQPASRSLTAKWLDETANAGRAIRRWWGS